MQKVTYRMKENIDAYHQRQLQGIWFRSELRFAQYVSLKNE